MEELERPSYNISCTALLTAAVLHNSHLSSNKTHLLEFSAVLLLDAQTVFLQLCSMAEGELLL
jgi:hypothetical protein